MNLNDLRSEAFLLAPLTYAATPTEEQMNAVALINNALRETELDILGGGWEGLHQTGCHTERPLGTMQLNRATCLDRCSAEGKVCLQPTRGGECHKCCLTNPRATQKHSILWQTKLLVLLPEGAFFSCRRSQTAQIRRVGDVVVFFPESKSEHVSSSDETLTA